MVLIRRTQKESELKDNEFAEAQTGVMNFDD